jgi:GT2 family glycosyltransferase
MISVVITVYNGADTLGVQLSALAAQDCQEPWELVLIDNGSTDHSVEVAKGFQGRIPTLRIVDETAQRGRPFALNAGVRAARGEAILMTDQDDEVAPGWLAAMGQALKRHDFVGCSVDHTKLNPPPLHWEQQRSELPRMWFPPYLTYASGTSLGFTRAVSETVGKFDETLKFVQDMDFCIRAQQQGFPLSFVPNAVLHYRRRTAFKDHYQQARNYARESAILAKRYWRRTDRTLPVFKDFIKEWINVAKLSRRVRTEHQQYDFTWRLGRQVGRFEGWCKHQGIPV